MSKVLTIAIPTYNMEKYLDNCLKSFLYNKDTQDLEVLIINDGSTDKSKEIALDYQSKYPNIFKLIDKENGGHGSTINKGLEFATGKYFKVIDSDDWVDSIELKRLVEILKQTNIDCLVSNYVERYEYNGKSKVVKTEWEKEFSDLTIKEISKFCFFMANSTYRTEAIRKIRIQEKCYFADNEYCLYAFCCCNTFKYIPLNVYQYRLGRAGQSVSIDGRFKHRKDMFKIFQNLMEFYEEKSSNFEDNKKKIAFDFIIRLLSDYYVNSIKVGCKYKEMMDDLREFNSVVKEYSVLYKELNNSKAEKLIKDNFKIPFWKKVEFKIKTFIKKIIRRN